MIFDIIVRIYMFIKSIIYSPNYSINRVGLEYTAPSKPAAGYSDFWKREEKYWTEEPTEYYADVTKCMNDITPVPSEIKDGYLHVEYNHDGKEYEYVTSNLEAKWPPKEVEGARFSMPIKTVMLLDEDESPVRCATNEIFRFMGPRKDFHGESVPVEKLLEWDDYEYLCVTNILGCCKTIHKSFSCLELL